MKKFLLLIFIYLLSNPFSAQSEEYKSIITVSSFSPFRDQRYNVGYLRKVSERWWIGTEVAYGANGMTPISIGNFEGKNRIFEIRPEVFYSLAPQSRLKHFVSAEAFYLNQVGKGVAGNYYDRNEDYYSFSSADYKRIKYGLNINYSILFHKETSWFGFMPKIGFGLRHRDISYTNTIDKIPADPPIDGLPFDYHLNREGSDLLFNFNIDIKLIFKF
ncbi:hypothetical protein [Chryseobacterium wangxinyae]|uniref:hypothetical protein n=1 Tax=Chryseobacterium sp. CY353 TaxID=2997334 RepID=UPI00226EE9AA|nr:hypothetical protein [Chryseobacterium sp. CY353]MCY0968050.1 hypothetical protein [Chryseobacterium sp. CY353]